MAKTKFPEIAHCISGELTPMVATARIIKKEHPKSRIVFIGPCAAKKLEASRKSVRSDVDFVITFEELMGMFCLLYTSIRNNPTVLHVLHFDFAPCSIAFLQFLI